MVLFSAISGAEVVDLGQPAWRGQSGTTFQQWDFLEPVTPEQPMDPDAGWVNPNGSAQLIYYPGSTTGWTQDVDRHQGVLPLSGSIQIDIPNFPVQNPYKDIIVQLVWAPETPRGNPFIDEALTGEVATLVETIQLDGPWQYSKYAIHLEPNPDFEQVWISGSIFVDSVIVDTICIPEPATLALVGLGGLLIRKKRRRVA